MLKIYSKLLALCVFHSNVGGITAFFVSAPKAQPSRSLYSSYSRSPEYGSVDYYEGSPFNIPLDDRDHPQQQEMRSPLRLYRPQQPGRRSPLAGYHGHPQQQGSNSYMMPHGQQSTQVQGGSRETWSASPYLNRNDPMQVTMETEGRPLHADFEVWQGPNNTPQRVKVYSEDGYLRPFRVAVPRGRNSAISIRNTGPLEFPLSGDVSQQRGRATQWPATSPYPYRSVTRGETVQGGSLRTFPFYDPSVGSVQVSLQTDGLPLMATVEVWQGPNNVKQIAEVYADDGMARPFEAVVETPGYGSTIAIRNSGPLEFPLTATVEPLYY